MISPNLNDRFHQAPSLLWLLNLCSELKGCLANAMALPTSPGLILYDLPIHLGVHETSPWGRHRASSMLHPFGKTSIPQLLKHINLKDKDG